MSEEPAAAAAGSFETLEPFATFEPFAYAYGARVPEGSRIRICAHALIRNHRIQGPYSRPMSRALRWS